MENASKNHLEINNILKNIALVLFVLNSFTSISQQPPKEYLEVCFQHQKFQGERILNTFLKKHKKKDSYKSAPCQFLLQCTFYLNDNGYVDSISKFKHSQYVQEPSVPFFDEIQREIEFQSKNYRFYNQIVYKNDTLNEESFTLFLDYECGRGWIINKYPSEFKKLKKLNRGISYQYKVK